MATSTTRLSAPFATLERIASGPGGLALVGVWAFGEAIALPIVVDVLLCLLVLVVPARLGPLYASVLVGALAGSFVLFSYAVTDPAAARDLVLAVPGIDQPMVDQASSAVQDGPLAAAVIGPGTPLKVYTLAWATGPGDIPGLVAAVLVNRLTRIGPTVLVAWLVGVLMPRVLRRWQWPVLIAYAAGWTAFYALYLS